MSSLALESDLGGGGDARPTIALGERIGELPAQAGELCERLGWNTLEMRG